MCLQKLINTGTQSVNIPYTLAISNPSYVLVQNSWNWGVSGSANSGTFSGAVSMVRMDTACCSAASCDPWECALQCFPETGSCLEDVAGQIVQERVAQIGPGLDCFSGRPCMLVTQKVSVPHVRAQHEGSSEALIEVSGQPMQVLLLLCRDGRMQPLEL